MKKTNTLIVAGAAAALMAGLSFAQDSKNQGYLVDSYGNNITTGTTTGTCVRSTEWTPPRAVAYCEPLTRETEIPVPTVVAAAPPGQPAAAPAPDPVKVPSRSLSFSADTLLAFDQAALKLEGKTLLDDFVRQLDGTQYEAIFVAGHTDRYGNNEYNQKLSERRANAVKEYLANASIPANRIKAEGRGETQPVTRPGDCQGTRNRKVVACLQPDRRVHVEVSSTAISSLATR